MTEITARLSTALADRYKIERHLARLPCSVPTNGMLVLSVVIASRKNG